MAPKKQIHINFFEVTCIGNHIAVGLWKNEVDNSRTKDTVDYYMWIAKLADQGKISCIFVADSYGGRETYQGKADAAYRSGGSVGQTDPTIWVSAMAAVSKNPFILARRWSTLDHATQGRLAWNVVTSYSNASAKAMEAHEYMDLCYSLWEGSWEDGAQTWKKPEGAYDPNKIHKIFSSGKHHKTTAYGATHPSPQRTPVIFQDGGSPQGKMFAAKHAEAIFCGGRSPEDIAVLVKEMRGMAEAQGRLGSDLNFFPSMTPIVGRTVEEARAKYDKYKTMYPLDEPLDYNEIKEGVVIEDVGTNVKKDPEPLTPRQLGERMAFCGGGNMPIGTPDMIADVMEEWINVGDIDGFNVASCNPSPARAWNYVERLCRARRNV
ncbi:bacterial luciferase-like protein [Hyaloscypha variabilis F]|uniref:Bacterial luciferase-like protein n=1 Tax=Hyaloscypha variabilis (strain UAMH 11265 / GT02V1 / F) TaxID=1149755 RepID=A0A2J6RJT7_HYAVF|nr:bacterial luciferase-like protein [Hyaloscypha variabilis F]